MENAASCTINACEEDECDSLTMEEAYECRQDFAAGFSCHDEDAMDPVDGLTPLNTKDITNPSNSMNFSVFNMTWAEGARKSGMTCKSWPWYNGGYPLANEATIQEWYFDFWSYATCNTSTAVTYADAFGSTHSYCSEWETSVRGKYSYSIGSYTCNETAQSSDGSTYCSRWNATLRETEMCVPTSGILEDCSPNCDEPVTCHVTCSDDDGYWECDYDTASTYRYLDGKCDTVNAEGVCMRSSQGSYAEEAGSLRWDGKYACNEVSLSGKRCQRWSGTADSLLEWTVSNCECMHAMEPEGYCAEWHCYSQGMSYFFPNIAMSAIIWAPVLLLTYAYNAATMDSELWTDHWDNFRAGFQQDQEQLSTIRNNYFGTFIIYLGMNFASAYLGGFVNIVIGFLGAVVFPCLLVELLTRHGDKVFGGAPRYYRLRTFYIDLVLACLGLHRWVENRQQARRLEREAKRIEAERLEREAEDEAKVQEAKRQRERVIVGMYAAVDADEEQYQSMTPEYHGVELPETKA